jgi:uncharacterized glyoxalase superfamily protein PhnB
VSESPKRSTFGSSVCYEDPKAALDWLEKAFGFAPSMVITDGDGRIVHAEMSFGDSYMMVGSKWADFVETPSALGGRNTQSVHVHLSEDIDAHCARARAAGAEILMEPEDQFYGDRSYRARDIAGHVWTFGQTVKVMTPAEWDAGAPGLITTLYEGKPV